MSAEPLRILVVVSRPLAQLVPIKHGGQKFVAVKPVAPEPVEAVRDGLRRVFLDDKTPARVRYLPWARLQDLLEALAEPYDVVHFVGHGDKEGNLLLEGDDGSVDPVSPQRLAKAMQGANVRLVLLSACHSGAAGRALHEAGIPNVVMVDERYPMHAEVAAIFNRQFYAWLARGKPPGEAYEAGVRAVRTDRRFGDEAPPPRNRQTGEIEPRYGERFDKIIADDRPLVEGIPMAGYEELYPSKSLCTVTREEIFVGREAKMIEVIRQMQTARLVTLTGPGGIGKTALARQVALWHAERHLFRDGVIEVNLENVRDDGGLLSQLAYALGVKPDSVRPWDTIRAALAGHRLVLLDGAENLTPQAVGCLSDQLLGRLEELHLLVTSHAPLHLVKYEQCIEVDELPVGHGEWIGPAEEMFIAYTPQKRQAEIVLEHFNAVREICRELGGYPLGILLEAAQLSDERETPESLLKALRANMVEALSYAQAAGLPERHKSVGAAMKSSYDRLSAAARQLLAHIAVFPGGASEKMLKDLEGLEEARWKEAERELRELGLVRWEQGRYRMLPPIRAWAQTTLPADELNVYRLRAARWLAEHAKMWNAMLTPGEKRRAAAPKTAQEVGQKVEEVESEVMLEALKVFARERENLLAAVDWAYNDQDWPLVVRLAGNLAGFFNLRALWDDWVWTHERALEAARRAGDRHGEGATLNNLGNVYAQQGRWEEAIVCYEKALETFRELRNRQGEGQTLMGLGSVYLQQGRWEEAIVNYEKALEIFRKLGDRHGEGATLMNLGNVYQLQGRWEEAIANYEKALEIFRKLGDRHGEAQTLGNLGNVYAQQGRWEEAIANYEKALEIFRKLGDRHGEGQTLTNLGLVYAQQGRWEEAIANYEKDLEICRALGDRHGEGQTLTNLGNVYTQQGRWEEAMACYEESLRIKRALGDRQGEGATLMGLGNVYRLQGRWEEAIANYEKALEIFRELGDRHSEGKTLSNIGNVYQLQGRWEEAIACYEKALETFRALGDRHGEAQTLNNLGVVYAQQGELEKALETATQALRIFEELKAYPDLVTCHRQIALLSLEAGDLSTSFSHLAQALLLSLQLHPKLVLDTIDRIVSIAKRLASEGRFSDVAVLGSELLGVVMEVGGEKLRSEELKASVVLAQRVCEVIAFMGKSRVEENPEERAKAMEMALTMAKEVDKATGKRWGLEEWVSGG
jgi:tetratricopeptide (TPR) repeat protein